MSALDVLASRRARRMAAGGLLAGVLAGCGIAPTGVIDAGEPARGIKQPGKPEADVQLFFLGPDGMRASSRPAAEPVDPQGAVDLLLDGPNSAERQRGLTSVLPKMGPGRITVTAKDGKVDMTLPINAKRLDTPALSQLVCTAANGSMRDDVPPEKVLVQVRGGGVLLPAMTCGGNNAFPVIQPGTAAPSGE